MQEHEIIAMLAQEVEVNDPIDWSMLRVDEETAYKLIANQVLEQFGDKMDRLTILSTITKLVVENFVLNLKLIEKESNGN
jgi:hypothetical protein